MVRRSPQAVERATRSRIVAGALLLASGCAATGETPDDDDVVDSADDCVVRVDRDGDPSEFHSYDADGRLTGKRAAEDDAWVVYSHEEDADGRVVLVSVDGEPYLSLGWDDDGRIARKEFPGTVSTYLDYRWNPDGSVEGMDTGIGDEPPGGSLEFTYERGMVRTGITTTALGTTVAEYSWGEDGCLQSVVTGSDVITHSADGQGRLTEARLDSGGDGTLEAHLEYDYGGGAGCLVAELASAPGGALLWHRVLPELEGPICVL